LIEEILKPARSKERNGIYANKLQNCIDSKTYFWASSHDPAGIL